MSWLTLPAYLEIISVGNCMNAMACLELPFTWDLWRCEVASLASDHDWLQEWRPSDGESKGRGEMGPSSLSVGVPRPSCWTAM